MPLEEVAMSGFQTHTHTHTLNLTSLIIGTAIVLNSSGLWMTVCVCYPPRITHTHTNTHTLTAEQSFSGVTVCFAVSVAVSQYHQDLKQPDKQLSVPTSTACMDLQNACTSHYSI